jgi:hypothetical protein
MTALRIFVRRGAIRRFHRLTRDAEGLPVSVEWDRRKQDRRNQAVPASTEQRGSDRRSEPPFTWNTAEFVVVQDPSDDV